MAGALVYAGLTFLISPKVTLLIQLFMPPVMLVTFLFILGKPNKILPTKTTTINGGNDSIQDPHVSVYGGKDYQSASDQAPLLGKEKEKEKIKFFNFKEKIRFFNKEEVGVFL